MNKNPLTNAALATLLLVSTSVMAESDYPATDFQPKVVYSDSSASQSQPAEADAAKVEAKAEADDANYPATNYKPKVVYHDADYKHSSTAPSASSDSSSAPKATASAASVSNEVIQNEKAGSSDFSMIGLIVLAIAGFFVFNKKSKVKSGSASSDDVAVSGSTGVEKYLEKMGANKTGVAKYLEKQTEQQPATGVAKYMAKQIVKDKAAAAASATGVEKYLRDKS